MKYLKIIILILIQLIIIETKNINIKCNKYYSVENESCFDVINKFGMKNDKFFNLNPNIDCSKIDGTTVCVEGIVNNKININNSELRLNYKIILTNEKLKENFEYYGKQAYEKFQTVHQLFDESFKSYNNITFNYTDCIQICKNGQSHYEKVINDKTNPYNFEIIKDINIYYGLSTKTMIEDPFNDCKRYNIYIY